MYNSVTRQVEMELFPSIRAYGLSFCVYNPLSGGLLTGRYRGKEGIPDEGRFNLMESYRDRYWQREFFDAVNVLGETCDTAGIEMTSAALTWLTRHSELDGGKGDGIIIGASKFDHLKQNLEYMGQPDLRGEVAEEYGKAWDLIKGTSPKYFRP